MPNYFTDSQCLTDLIQKMDINYEFLWGSAVVLIVLGILNVFLGYPIFRIVLCIFAGLAGGSASYVFAFGAFGGDIAASVIIAVTAGVLALLALYQLYRMSVFLAGGALGWFLSYAIMNFLGVVRIPLVIAISVVACGLIALLIQKFAIILATSLFGAVYATLGVAQLVGHGLDPKKLAEDPGAVIDWQNPGAKFYIMVGCVVLLAVVGMFVQYKITSVMGRKREEPEEIETEKKPEPEDEFED